MQRAIYFYLHRSGLPETLQDVNAIPGANLSRNNSVKNYMSAKVGWAVGFIA
jgi:hypothetical protein